MFQQTSRHHRTLVNHSNSCGPSFISSLNCCRGRWRDLRRLFLVGGSTEDFRGRGIAARPTESLIDKAVGHGCWIHRRNRFAKGSFFLKGQQKTLRKRAAGSRDGNWEHGPQTAFEEWPTDGVWENGVRKRRQGQWLPDPQNALGTRLPDPQTAFEEMAAGSKERFGNAAAGSTDGI